jgi:hypothetical protein
MGISEAVLIQEHEKKIEKLSEAVKELKETVESLMDAKMEAPVQ